MGRRKGSSRVEPEIATFVTSAQSVIAPWLAGFGFSPGEKDVSRYSARISFINGARYVRLCASSEPRDPPRHCEVVLGEGNLKWPEVDWNGVRLWRLARAEGESEALEYPLEGEEAVLKLVGRMRMDLERYGLGFLQGDVSTFRSVRAEINRTRAPYMIHKPNADGTYTTEVDPGSAELKARFS